MTGHLGSQRGVATIMVLAFMVLAVPLITSALALTSSLSVDSRIKAGILRSQYAVLGGTQYAAYRLAYESGYAESLSSSVPDVFTVSLMGDDVTVSVLKVTEVAGDPPPPSWDSSRRLRASKAVSPTSAQPGTLTAFTYTVTVENMDEEPEGLRKIHDMLPPDFSYKAGTSTGVTTDDPSITVHIGDEDSPPVQQLTWNLATLKITLQPGATTTVSFVAEATAAQGNYCNEAWVEPGGEKTSSGKTARVQVGSPPDTLCGGQAVSVTKTVTPQVAPGDVLNSFTYTIALESVGTEALNLSRVRDLLPPGFLYVSSSTTGDLAWGEPTVTMLQGRQRLTWDLAPPFQLDPGQTVSVSFGTEATAPSGDYWNEAWITFDEFTYSIYTGPTARVKLMSVSEATASHGSSTASSEVWLGTDSYLIDRWIISR